ncbi:MAG: ABC transporter ATP-binding protein [Lachnospiraceae bacterium]|nr:ABC transporter ATP-binding protein [Lachnospiraceae bacterium]
MKNTVLRVEHITVGYHHKVIQREVSFEVAAGEILVLIGPNGAGKSTLLKSITGQLPLLDGEVYLHALPSQENPAPAAAQKEQGAALREMPLSGLKENELARIMALMMTMRVEPEYATGYDIVAAGRYPYTGSLGLLTDHDREVIERSMHLVKAEELAAQPFHTLSDGQRQRILLARAICQEPRILVLDEPTGFLDIKHKLEFLKALRFLVDQQQIAVVMSLHELDLAEKIADRVLCVSGTKGTYPATAKEAFHEAAIEELFEMQPGSLAIDRI